MTKTYKEKARPDNPHLLLLLPLNPNINSQSHMNFPENFPFKALNKRRRGENARRSRSNNKTDKIYDSPFPAAQGKGAEE
jgi:hypothetical protein